MIASRFFFAALSFKVLKNAAALLLAVLCSAGASGQLGQLAWVIGVSFLIRVASGAACQNFEP